MFEFSIFIAQILFPINNDIVEIMPIRILKNLLFTISYFIDKCVRSVWNSNIFTFFRSDVIRPCEG